MNFPPSLTQSDDGMAFVKHAFSVIEQQKPDDIKLSLSMLYDEFMGLTTYTAASFAEMPLQSVRQWPQETYSSVSKERERMALFVELEISESFGGMSWHEFCSLTPEQTEMLLEVVQTHKLKKAAAGKAVLSGMGEANKALKNLGF